MLSKKLFLTAALAAWFLFLGFMHSQVATFARSYEFYGHQFLGSGFDNGDLPSFTTDISMPVLKGGSWISTAYSLVIWGVPLILCAGIWRIRRRVRLMEWSFYGFGVYYVFVIFSAVIIAIGLFLPFYEMLGSVS